MRNILCKCHYFVLACSLLSTPISFAQTKSAALKNGMVVSEFYLASKVGQDILRSGGNAIDAAVAVAYALAVTNPCCGNIGGGGFMTIHLANGKNTFLNFREKAPGLASRNMFLGKKADSDKQLIGYLAVAVPGTVLGLETALQKYGSKSRQEVMQGAIDLAEHGFMVTNYLEKQMNDFSKVFSQQANIAAIFMHDGHTYQAGQRLIQTNLAHTLKLISQKGAQAFYKGKIADAIASASQAHDGLLSKKDFADYQVKELKPIFCSYRGYDIYSAPLPSSGGVALCEMLTILDFFPLKSDSFDSAKSKRTIIEAMRYTFLDRNAELGDPDFVNNPTAHLLSKSYAKKLSKKIKSSAQAPGVTISVDHKESTETTHLSVVDKAGNAVALTYTLNGFFGAKVMAGDTGFFLNNTMDDFATHPGVPNQFGLIESAANDIQANKRPLSSMTPTIILKNGHLVMVLGSPGGPRIITAVALAIINVLDYGMSLSQAIDRPRYHYQVSPNFIDIEPNTFTHATMKILQDNGYTMKTQKSWGSVEAIVINPKTGAVMGVNDQRRPDGKALAD